jgi:hypothetical protein
MIRTAGRMLVRCDVASRPPRNWHAEVHQDDVGEEGNSRLEGLRAVTDFPDDLHAVVFEQVV